MGESKMADPETRIATVQDTAAMVWDLVEGFALLSGRIADQFTGQQASPLAAVLARMGDRAAEIGKTDLANRLHSARGRFEDMLPPG
jgi:hypothetical protein